MKTFLNGGRPVSAYSLLRFAEGGGGVDIFDINLIKNENTFKKGYNGAMNRVEQQARHFLNKSNDKTFEDLVYHYKGQNIAVLFDDAGTSLGSYGLKYVVTMHKTVVDGEEIVQGIVYFMLADTYRWNPDRKTDYTGYGEVPGLGDHKLMTDLKDIGAEEYSIRAYFISSFTYKNATWAWDRMDHTPAEDLDNNTGDLVVPEISQGKGYQLILGSECNDFRPQ